MWLLPGPGKITVWSLDECLGGQDWFWTKAEIQSTRLFQVPQIKLRSAPSSEAQIGVSPIRSQSRLDWFPTVTRGARAKCSTFSGSEVQTWGSPTCPYASWTTPSLHLGGPRTKFKSLSAYPKSIQKYLLPCLRATRNTDSLSM